MLGVSTGLNLDARKVLQLSSGLIALPSHLNFVHGKSVDSAVCDIAVSALLLCVSTRGCRFEFQKCFFFFNYKIRAGVT